MKKPKMKKKTAMRFLMRNLWKLAEFDFPYRASNSKEKHRQRRAVECLAVLGLPISPVFVIKENIKNLRVALKTFTV